MAEPRYSKRSFKKVSNVLSNNPGRAYTQSELTGVTGVSQPVVSRILKYLESTGNIHVSRATLPTKYTIRGVISETDIGTASNKQRDPFSIIESLNTDEFHAFLETWSKATWEPKVTKSLRNLPHGIAALYSLSIEAVYGAEVTSEDLIRIRKLFYETRHDVVKTLAVIDRFLATNEVWNAKEVTLFLAGNRNVEKLQNLVHRVREIN